MARGINKVILVGNLGGDPEVRYMPSGNAVTNVTLATSESWKDKQSGNLEERTEWHRVVFFNKLAEIAGEYLRKGAQVYVEGSLRTRKWQDQSGQDRYTTEVVASEMQMLGGRQDGQQGGNQGGYQQQGSQQQGNQNQNRQQGNQNQQRGQGNQNRQQGNQNRQQGGQNQQGGYQNNQPPQGGFDDFDDDIPF